MKLMMLMNKDEEVELKRIHMGDHYEDIYEEMFECLRDILDNHPVTWKKYKGAVDECDHICNMEIGELIEAKKEKDFHELEKEYLHCAAAFLYGYEMAKEHKHKKH